MYLAGYHKIHLPGTHFKLLKIYGVVAAPFSKKYQVVECMAVSMVEVGVYFQVVCKRLCNEVVVNAARIGERADINNGELFFCFVHCYAKVQICYFPQW